MPKINHLLPPFNVVFILLMLIFLFLNCYFNILVQFKSWRRKHWCTNMLCYYSRKWWKNIQLCFASTLSMCIKSVPFVPQSFCMERRTFSGYETSWNELTTPPLGWKSEPMPTQPLTGEQTTAKRYLYLFSSPSYKNLIFGCWTMLLICFIFLLDSSKHDWFKV